MLLNGVPLQLTFFCFVIHEESATKTNSMANYEHDHKRATFSLSLDISASTLETYKRHACTW